MNEPFLIDRLADTTSRRERDALDRDIVSMLVDSLSAQSVVLYHSQRDGVAQWMVERMRFARESLQAPPRVPHDYAGVPALTDREE